MCAIIGTSVGLLLGEAGSQLIRVRVCVLSSSVGGSEGSLSHLTLRRVLSPLLLNVKTGKKV